jgi:hypothetical protein
LLRRCPDGAITVIPDQAFLKEKDDMADHGEVEYATADGNDYAEHEGTYDMFITLTKWMIGFLVILLIGMAYFLV